MSFNRRKIFVISFALSSASGDDSSDREELSPFGFVSDKRLRMDLVHRIPRIKDAGDEPLAEDSRASSSPV